VLDRPPGIGPTIIERLGDARFGFRVCEYHTAVGEDGPSCPVCALVPER
jgi:hypothetical protein